MNIMVLNTIAGNHLIKNYGIEIIGDILFEIKMNITEFQNILKWNDDKFNYGKGNVVMEIQSSYNSEIWMV